MKNDRVTDLCMKVLNLKLANKIQLYRASGILYFLYHNFQKSSLRSKERKLIPSTEQQKSMPVLSAPNIQAETV